MKRGFTLIELLAALAIASVVITLLFNSFFQTTGIISRADNNIGINMRAIVLQHQLEKDIMGAFFPVQAVKEEDKAKKNKEQQQKQTAQAQGEQKKVQPSPPPVKEEKKEKKRLKKAFYGINQADMLSLVTFITNNPMSAYWSKKIGKAKPKIARVVYRLVEDKQEKGVYTLYRQEGTSLEFEDYGSQGKKPIRSYPVAGGIKKLSIKYYVVIEKEKEEKKPPVLNQQESPKSPPKEEKKKREIKFKTLDQWNFEKEKPKDIKRPIPNVVEISITFWNEKRTGDASYKFSIPIIPEINDKKKEEIKPQQKKGKQQPSSTDEPSGGQPSGGRSSGGKQLGFDQRNLQHSGAIQSGNMTQKISGVKKPGLSSHMHANFDMSHSQMEQLLEHERKRS